jgi:large subunit ribosomal protein L9
MHDVKVALHPEVSVTVHVNVARSPEEAELQAQGIDVIKAMFEEQAAPIAAEALAPEAEETEAEAEAEAPAEEASAEEAPAEAEEEAPAAEEAEQPEAGAE